MPPPPPHAVHFYHIVGRVKKDAKVELKGVVRMARGHAFDRCRKCFAGVSRRSGRLAVEIGVCLHCVLITGFKPSVA